MGIKFHTIDSNNKTQKYPSLSQIIDSQYVVRPIVILIEVFFKNFQSEKGNKNKRKRHIRIIRIRDARNFRCCGKTKNWFTWLNN